MYKKSMNKSLKLTDEQIITALQKFLEDCDAEDLCQLAEDAFGGEFFFECDHADEWYEFTPDMCYGGAFDEIAKQQRVKATVYTRCMNLDCKACEKIVFANRYDKQTMQCATCRNPMHEVEPNEGAYLFYQQKYNEFGINPDEEQGLADQQPEIDHDYEAAVAEWSKGAGI